MDSMEGTHIHYTLLEKPIGLDLILVMVGGGGGGGGGAAAAAAAG